MSESIEILIITLLIIGQFYTAIKITLMRIREFENVLHDSAYFGIRKAFIKISEIETVHPVAILSNLNNQKNAEIPLNDQKLKLFYELDVLEKDLKIREEEIVRYQNMIDSSKVKIYKTSVTLGAGNLVSNALKTEEDLLKKYEAKLRSLSLENTGSKQNMIAKRKEIENIENRILIESKVPVVETVEVGLITSASPGSAAQQSILNAINTYLIRNRSAVADFNLIKDIVERTSSTIEEEINNTVSVPLYMGLLGTMFGIIFGLYNIPDLSLAISSSQSTALDAAVPTLLSGVKIAMFASLFGLGLTIANSAFFFRRAKTIVEEKKNNFYSFVQVELLPVLNQSINSSLASLQNNLHKFNDDFTINLNSLGIIMHKNHDAIIAQDKILSTLDKIDINDYAKANVKVLKELQNSMDSFRYFNDYVNNITSNLELTKSVSIRLSKLIDSVDGMNNLALNINRSFVENNRLITFFNDHKTGLDDNKTALKEAVGGVSKSLKDAIAELNDTTKASILELRQMVTNEIRIMNEEYPKKWDKLNNLDEIKNNSSQIKQSLEKKVAEMQNNMDDVKKSLKSIDQSIRELTEHTVNRESWISRIQTKLRDTFSRN